MNGEPDGPVPGVRGWGRPLRILIVASLLVTACAARGVTAGGQAQMIPGTWAVVRDGDLWLVRPDVPQRQLTHLHLSPAVRWSALFWDAGGEQVAATFADISDPASQPVLVIINIATGATERFDQATDAHHHLAGWITSDQLLLAGDSTTPGLIAFSTTTQSATVITSEAVAAIATTPDTVWFIAQRQQVQDGALLSQWDARTLMTSAAAYLPGFAVDGAGFACGRLHLSIDGSTILYDSRLDDDGIPCPHPAGPWLMRRDGGTAMPLFVGQAGIGGTARDFVLDPAGQWVAAATMTADGGVIAFIERNSLDDEATGGAGPISLTVTALAGAGQITLTPMQDAFAITAPEQNNTRVALITSDGRLLAGGTLPGAQAAVAPSPSDTNTVSTDDIQCPAGTGDNGGDGLRIAVIGDSLAQGYGTSDPAQCSFAEQLQVMRIGGGQPIRLLVQGMGGYRVDQMLTTLPAIVAFAPDVAIIELGTNDVREHWPPDQTQAAYDTIVTALRDAAGTHSAHPAILCMEPWPSPGYDTPAQLAPYDAIITQECAQAAGSRIARSQSGAGGTAIDIAPLMTAGMMNNTLAPDFNWHPNDRGALNLARG